MSNQQNLMVDSQVLVEQQAKKKVGEAEDLVLKIKILQSRGYMQIQNYKPCDFDEDDILFVLGK